MVSENPLITPCGFIASDVLEKGRHMRLCPDCKPYIRKKAKKSPSPPINAPNTPASAPIYGGITPSYGLSMADLHKITDEDLLLARKQWLASVYIANAKHQPHDISNTSQGGDATKLFQTVLSGVASLVDNYAPPAPEAQEGQPAPPASWLDQIAPIIGGIIQNPQLINTIQGVVSNLFKKGGET